MCVHVCVCTCVYVCVHKCVCVCVCVCVCDFSIYCLCSTLCFSGFRPRLTFSVLLSIPDLQNINRELMVMRFKICFNGNLNNLQIFLLK